MNRIRLTATIMGMAAAALAASAQTPDSTRWSLERCIEYAIDNNISIKKQQLQVETEQNNLLNARLQRYPTVSGNAYYNAAFGRVANPTTYEVSNITTHYSSVGVDASMPIFAGMQISNSIKRQKLTLENARIGVEMAKNDLNVNIAVAYLQVLLDRELLDLARRQVEISRQQTDNADAKVKAQLIAQGELMELQSQLSKEAMQLTQQENALSLSRLALAQMLDLPGTDGFDIQSIDAPELSANATASADDIYAAALQTQPRIRNYQNMVEDSEYALRIARGALCPTLALTGGWSTNTSYMDGMQNYSLSSDLKDNSSCHIGLSLHVPIFSGLDARTKVRNAKVGIESAQLSLDNERLTLRKEVQQAYADANNALRKYFSAKDAVASYGESFAYTQRKFDAGLATSLDLNTAKNELTRAESEMLQAKYEYLLRSKIIDFYMGKPIY